MTDNSKLCCARFRSRASAVNKGFWQRILGHVLCLLSILLSISLYLPPPIFHSFSIRSSSSPGIANTSAGGRITDKSPGVLDSAALAGVQRILACRTRCHIGLKNQPRKAVQFKHNTDEPAGAGVCSHADMLTAAVCWSGLFLCNSLWWGLLYQ